MAKAQKREWVWLQCTETGDLNYRTTVNVMGGVPKRLERSIAEFTKNFELEVFNEYEQLNGSGFMSRYFGGA